MKINKVAYRKVGLPNKELNFTDSKSKPTSKNVSKSWDKSLTRERLPASAPLTADVYWTFSRSKFHFPTNRKLQIGQNLKIRFFLTIQVYKRGK